MYILVLLGIVTGIAAILLLINPELCFEFGRKYFVSTKFQYGTAILSLVLALALYFASSTTRFPAVFEIVALFTLVGGVICVALPPADFKSIVSWELKVFLPYGRVLGIWYGIVGGFLIYAAT